MSRPEWSDRDVRQLRRLLEKFGPARVMRCMGEQCYEACNNPQLASCASTKLARAGNFLEAHSQRIALQQVPPYLFVRPADAVR